jgi:hypothetical protein
VCGEGAKFQDSGVFPVAEKPHATLPVFGLLYDSSEQAWDGGSKWTTVAEVWTLLHCVQMC